MGMPRMIGRKEARDRQGGIEMLGKLRRFMNDEAGPTAVEYAIMVAGIAVVIIAVVFLLGSKANVNSQRVPEPAPAVK
jgi:pilus assembly protein Flp/PilA